MQTTMEIVVFNLFYHTVFRIDTNCVYAVGILRFDNGGMELRSMRDNL